MSVYHFVIGSCAILTVMAIYRVHLSGNFALSAAVGGLAVAVGWIILIIIGALTS